jgi:radical SAM superfamily enzyme YgiQ (UPF0313 family)
MFRHVLCVYPYRQELKRFKFFPPIGLEYIGTVIKPHAQALDVIDLRKEPGHTLDFLRPETEMVCFSINWERDIDFLREEISSVPPDIFTVLGGRHVTENPGGWLANHPNVDAVVRGDGEEVMEDVCHGMPLENIAGLSFRNGNNISHNPNRKLKAIRDHPYLNRSLRRHPYEVEIGNVSTGVELDLLSASRGCPFNCTFCSFNFNPWGEKRNWSGRSPEAIVEELAQIKAPVVGFTDEIFTYDMDRVERICDLILESGIRKKYVINARLEIARRPDVIRKMELAGFAMLLLGIESAHDKTLRSMHKGFTTNQIRKYFDVLRGRPLMYHGYFILGNIGESVEEMMQMVPFARELALDTVNISLLRCSPFSGLEELLAQNPDYHIAPSGKVFSEQCSIKQLKRLRSRLVRQFYTKSHMLSILDKGRRTGLLRVFLTQSPSSLAKFFHSLLKVSVSSRHR